MLGAGRTGEVVHEVSPRGQGLRRTQDGQGGGRGGGAGSAPGAASPAGPCWDGGAGGIGGRSWKGLVSGFCL